MVLRSSNTGQGTSWTSPKAGYRRTQQENEKGRTHVNRRTQHEHGRKLLPDWLTMVYVRNIKRVQLHLIGRYPLIDLRQLIQKDCIRFMFQVLCASDRLS